MVALAAEGYLILRSIDGRDLARTELDGPISRLRWRPDGQSFVTAEGHDGESTVTRWTFEKSKRWSSAFVGSHKAAIVVVASNPNGRYLATVSQDGVLKTWDVDFSGGDRTHKAGSHSVLAVAWNPNNSAVATGHAAGLVNIWRTGARTREIFEHDGREIRH